MNGGFRSYGFLLLALIVMVFALGNQQYINATTTTFQLSNINATTTTFQLSNINDNHNFFPFSLPFSSNLAEDSVNEQTYVNIIPFP